MVSKQRALLLTLAAIFAFRCSSCSLLVAKGERLRGQGGSAVPAQFARGYSFYREYRSRFIMQSRLYQFLPKSRAPLRTVAVSKCTGTAMIVDNSDSINKLVDHEGLALTRDDVFDYIDFVYELLHNASETGPKVRLIRYGDVESVKRHLFGYLQFRMSFEDPARSEEVDLVIASKPDSLSPLTNYFVDVTDSLRVFFRKGNIDAFDYYYGKRRCYTLKRDVDSFPELKPKVMEDVSGYSVEFYSWVYGGEWLFCGTEMLEYKHWHIGRNGKITVIDRRPAVISIPTSMVSLW